jgi:predicted small secreted protein
MKQALAKSFLVLFVLASAASMLSACNTTEGAGKDISSAGHKISGEAQEHK